MDKDVESFKIDDGVNKKSGEPLCTIQSTEGVKNEIENVLQGTVSDGLNDQKCENTVEKWILEEDVLGLIHTRVAQLFGGQKSADLSITVQDMCQNVVIKVLLSQNKFVGGRDNFMRRVKAITYNMYIDEFRKQKSKKVNLKPVHGNNSDFSFLTLIQDSVYTSGEQFERNEASSILYQAIQQLPQDQRDVVVLRHFADMSFIEITKITKGNLNTILGRMRYALINLRKMPNIQHYFFEGKGQDLGEGKLKKKRKIVNE